MRLWHKDLIPYLPKQQLLGQWRECCCIAKNIHDKGTPNHILVNKIMDYPIEHFFRYGYRVWKEMRSRQYNVDWNKFSKWFNNMSSEYAEDKLYATWHNDRYLLQCLYNLQEKYDCGGISEEEWCRINEFQRG